MQRKSISFWMPIKAYFSTGSVLTTKTKTNIHDDTPKCNKWVDRYTLPKILSHCFMVDNTLSSTTDEGIVENVFLMYRFLCHWIYNYSKTLCCLLAHCFTHLFSIEPVSIALTSSPCKLPTASSGGIIEPSVVPGPAWTP